jgi:hypothetical protein
MFAFHGSLFSLQFCILFHVTIFFFCGGEDLEVLIVTLETSKLPPLNSVVPTEGPHADNDGQYYQS